MTEFIQITEPEDVVVVDNFIKRARWNEGGFTPDKALTVLSKTNHCYNIKTVVKEINKLEVEERKAYKDFVIGAVNGRETTAEVLESLRELARSGGYEKEFDEANSKEKLLKPTDWNVFIAKSKDDFKNDLSGYKVVFCDFVDKGCYVGLSRCDLNGLNLKFKEGAKVYLEYAKNLPKDLDFSTCDEVRLGRCNLSGVERLKFRNGAKVDLYGAKNLPLTLDLSTCDKVDLRYCDLNGLNLKFKDKEQQQKFMRDSKNFSGRFVYTDIKAPFTNGGMEM